MTIKEEIQIEEYKRTFAEAYKQGFIDAMSVCKTEPTISKMEQVDKDINVRSKTENCSEKPNNCEPQTCDTCKWGEWYRKGYDITMMDDECGGCCSWNSKWTPKDEPQTERSSE